MRRETEDAKLKQLQVLQRYNVTMNDLEEYRRNIRRSRKRKNHLAKELVSKESEIEILI